MGWFKKRKLESEPVRPTGRDERRDAGAYPKLYKNAPLDVTKLDGELITRARLIRFSAWELRLERLPGELSLPSWTPATWFTSGAGRTTILSSRSCSRPWSESRRGCS